MLSLDNDLMKRKVFRAVAILAGILGVALVIFRADDPVNSVALPLTSMQRPVGDGFQPITPMQAVAGLDPKRVALGQQLFHDARLSGDLTIACANCHGLQQGGVDGQKVSTGVQGRQGGINAPTVFNSAYSIAQFWDGRADSLEAQAAGPIHNPLEMASNWAQVLGRLGQDADLVAAFRAAYRDGLTAANIADAIASFERSLVTLNAPFDRYLNGDRQALNAAEIEGYRRFRELGCSSCHQGMLVGGNMFQKFGVLKDYFAGRALTDADLGRYNVTRRDEDRHVFKVPSLRNVALTAPYFHDASAATLEQAVTVMGRYQLGRELPPQDVEFVVAFLKTLSGEMPASAHP